MCHIQYIAKGVGSLESHSFIRDYSKIKSLIEKLGIDGTDDYLRSELLILSKEVAATREQIYSIKEKINYQNNSDELRHLDFQLNELKELLDRLLKKLKHVDEIYISYKEYLKEKKFN